MKFINIKKIPEIGTDLLLAILLLFLPVLYGGVQPWVILVLHLLTTGLLFLWMLRGWIENKIIFKRTPLDIPFIIFTGMYLFYTLNTVYPYGSYQEFFKFLNYIVLYYITVNHITDRRKIKIFTWIIIIIGTGMSIYGFHEYFSGIKTMLSPSYVCHNHFAGLMELCLPLSLSLILTEEKAFGILSGIASVIMGFALMYSMSRGGWMAFGASFIFVIILFLWKRGNFYSGAKERKIFLTNLIVWVLIILALSIPLIAKERWKTILQFEGNQMESEALSFRIPVWKNTWQMIKDQNYLGKGLGTFIYLYLPYNKEYPDGFINAAHSDYLQMGMEAGMAGVIAFFIIIITFYVCIITYLRYKGDELTPFTKQMIRKDQLIAIGYTGAITGLVLHGMGDFNFQIPANCVYFFLIMALAVNIRALSPPYRSKKEIIEETEPVTSKKLLALTVIFSIFLLFITFITGKAIMAEYYFLKGIENEKTLLWEKSLEEYDMAQFLNPAHPSYYKQAGYISSKLSVIDDAKSEEYRKKAIEYYKKAEKANPCDSIIYYSLGRLYAEKKEDDLRRENYEKMLKLDPWNRIYILTFASYWESKGEKKKAIEIYEHYLVIQPKNKQIIDMIEKLKKL